MSRWAAVVMAVALAGCSQSTGYYPPAPGGYQQVGPVVYRQGPPPPNGMQVYADALRSSGNDGQRHEQERQAQIRHQEQMDVLRRQEQMMREEQWRACRARGQSIC